MVKDTTSKKQIVTRFAPSPTGNLHIGGFRTALFSFLYARHFGGKFILRIEDTDLERSRKEFEQNILDGLEWLHIKHDEIYRQTERLDIYRRYLEKLISSGKAYISKEENTGEGKRSEVIRFKNPKSKVTFSDIIRGEISFDTTELGDFVIAKSLTEPLYHFAVVVDDHEMAITHVIRGEEHLSNTPRQILIGEAIGANRPIYAHLPLILAPDRSKLSKRKGARAVIEYKEKGFLPEALLNYTALLGWNPGDNREIFSLDELIAEFDLAKVQKSGAIYNEEKLRFVNREYIKKMPPDELEKRIVEIFESSEYIKKKKWKVSHELASAFTPIILDRVEVFEDVDLAIEQGEYDYFFEKPEYDPKDLIWRDEKDGEKTIEHMKHAANEISILSEDEIRNSVAIKKVLWDYATLHGRGSVLWPIRFALTGKTKSPDPFAVISALGKDESLERIKTAIKKLSHSSK